MNKQLIMPSVLTLGIVYGCFRSGMFGYIEFNKSPVYTTRGIYYDKYLFESGNVEYHILPKKR